MWWWMMATTVEIVMITTMVGTVIAQNGKMTELQRS